MIDEREIEAATEEFCKNPGWKEELDEAPTEISRRYEKLIFYFSINIGELHEDPQMMEDFRGERARLEDEMGIEDWKYVYKYCGNNPMKTKRREKIEELCGLREEKGKDAEGKDKRPD